MMSTYNLPGSTHISHLHLRVRSLQIARTFYTGIMGLVVMPGSEEDNTLNLGADPEGKTLLTLSSEQAARTRPFRTTGLYHIAYLFPDRYALACTLKRILQHGWPLQGTADHGVSEAIYLADPEGNGIELYVDRPQKLWPRREDKIAMGTKPLSLESILMELGDCSRIEIDPATRLGHIHLNVSNLDNTRKFYNELVGFQVTQDDYPGALFLAAGGYHHHIGANIWYGKNAPPPPQGAAGLVSYTITIPDDNNSASLQQNLIANGIETFESHNGFWAFDPSGIAVNFTQNSM